MGSTKIRARVLIWAKGMGLAVIAICFVACSDGGEGYMISQQDKMEIEALKERIPLVLANEGWEAYESNFSADYQNWHMLSDEVRDRDEFLPLVKQWYEEGNRAVGSEVETVAFIPLTKNKVMYLHKQREAFAMVGRNDTIFRDIRFISIFNKDLGVWKVEFTAFMDAP